MTMYFRISEKLKTHVILLLMLFVVLGMSTGLVWAKGPVLNPAQLGTFCPPGSELADAKHVQILSIKEQAQIKKTVQGFMDLDADARRGGNPLGTAEYWGKGYTLRFEDKAAPVDWLEYITLRFSNLCVQEDSVFYIPLIDIAVFGREKLRRFGKVANDLLKNTGMLLREFWLDRRVPQRIQFPCNP